MLILGCGNPHRGDDSAGVKVIEKLRELGIAAETCSGQAADLIEAWAGRHEVLLVDAVESGAPVGTVHVWDGWQAVKAVKPPPSTHGLGIAEAIAIAHELDRLPGRLRFFGIEARRFEPGAEPSPELQAGISDVVHRIVALMHNPV